MSGRVESDTMGEIEVPAGSYWGAQTQRSLENFRIGSHRFPPAIIAAFGVVKKAAAIANRACGMLDEHKAELVIRAADEVIAGELDAHFPLVVWQTGSGTQSNMNANEVIANRANELAGAPRGAKSPVHPNDDVNASQSSNDVFPTVMHVAAARALRGALLPAIARLHGTLDEKSRAFAGVIKIGRTHLMDATPLSLGQEISGWAAQLDFARRCVEQALEALMPIAIGGSAVGTGMNTHPELAARATQEIAELTGLPFRVAENRFAALAAHDAIVFASGCTRVVAVACTKIANDVRLLASGPRCGLGEIHIPANEPGSSIMPGKVNPTQAEALAMVCAEVMGNDATIGIAGASGHLELNTYKPVMIHDLLESVGLLADAIVSFDERCAAGIEPDRPAIARNLERSLMLVTALVPVLGYDRAAEVAKTAHARDITLREAAVEVLGVMPGEQYDALVRPELMITPRERA